MKRTIGALIVASALVIVIAYVIGFLSGRKRDVQVTIVDNVSRAVPIGTNTWYWYMNQSNRPTLMSTGFLSFQTITALTATIEESTTNCDIWVTTKVYDTNQMDITAGEWFVHFGREVPLLRGRTPFQAATFLSNDFKLVRVVYK